MFTVIALNCGKEWHSSTGDITDPAVFTSDLLRTFTVNLVQ